MKQVLLAALMTTAFAANATDITIMPKPVTVINNPSASAGAKAGAVSGASSSSKSNQIQRQSQTSSNDQQQRASSASTSQGGNAQGGAGGLGGNSQSDNTNLGNNANTTVQVARNPVSSAASITIMPTAVCAGTTGAGAQGASFGVSFGTSWTDENCMLLERVRTVSAILGDTAVAEEMMCSDESYRVARESLGRPCSAWAAHVAKVKQAKREERAREIMYSGGGQ